MALPYLREALGKLVGKPSTEAFPKVIPEAADNYRGRIVYHADRCINCGMCIRVCSPQAITKTVVKNEDGDDVVTMSFDMTSCTFCNTCADFCAKKSIELTKDYMIVGTKAEDFIVTGTFVKKKPAPKPIPPKPAAPAAATAAAAAAPAAPAGGEKE